MRHRSLRRSRSVRLSSHPRTLRFLAAGTLAGALSSPLVARADEVQKTSNVNASAVESPLRLTPITNQEAGQGPRVSIVQPSYSDLVRGDAAIVIAVEANGAPTKSVQLFVDGVSASEGGAIAFENLPSAQFNWQTGKFKDGAHQLSVRVTDANGFIGQADTQVYVNNSKLTPSSAPKLSWMNVHDGDLLHGQADLQLQAAGNFGVKYLVITVNSIASPDRMPPLRASLINRAPYVYSLDTMRLPDGVYVLKARGFDVLQNQSETQQIAFGVSNNGLNPTVIERLDEVLKTRAPEKTTLESSTGNDTTTPTLSTKTLTSPRRDARMAPVKTAVETVIATKAVPKIATPKVVKSATPKVQTQNATVVKSVKSSAAHENKAVRLARASETISAIAPQKSLDAAQLILPNPSLTTASLAVSVEPTLSAATVQSEEISVAPSKVSLPNAAQRATQNAPVKTSSSTRLAKANVEIAPVSSAAEVAPTMTTAPMRASETRTASESVQTTTPETVVAARQSVSLPDVSSPKLSSVKVAAEVSVSDVSVAPELRQSRALPTVVPGKPLNAPELRRSRSVAGVLPTKMSDVQTSVESKIAVKTAPFLLAKSTTPMARATFDATTNAPILTAAKAQNAPMRVATTKSSAQTNRVLERAPQRAAMPSSAIPQRVAPQRLAMLPTTSRRDLRDDATISQNKTNVTETSKTVQAVKAAQTRAQIGTRMTRAILSSDDLHVASVGDAAARSIRVRNGSTANGSAGNGSRVVLQMISLPTNLGTPARPNTNAPRASISMSPVTIAALGARGAAGTLPALHVVGKGETLRSLANRYGLPVRTLATVNGLTEKAVLATGDKLKLPRALNFRFGGENASSDIGAIMVGNTSVAPFRFLFEQQGGKIVWDQKHQRITATNGDNQVTLSIGSREATVNDQKEMMDMAAFLLSGRTMVPIRFFEKALQAQVQWEPSTGRIYISMSNG